MKYESEPEVCFKVDGQSVEDWEDNEKEWLEFTTVISVIESFTPRKNRYPNLYGPFSKDLYTLLYVTDYMGYKYKPEHQFKYYDFIQILSGNQKLQNPTQVIEILQFLLVYSSIKPASKIYFYIGDDAWFHIEGTLINTALKEITVIGTLFHELESLNLDSFCVEIEKYDSYFKTTKVELKSLLSLIKENVENELKILLKDYGEDSSIRDFLSSNKIDINITDKDGETVIFSAARKGSIETVKYLVASRADVNYKNNLGRTPLLIAAWNNSVDIVKYLVEIGSDITVIDNLGMNALIASAWDDSVEVVKYLFETGFDINYVDEKNQSALSIAVWKVSIKVMEYLLESGADIDSVDKDGETALFGAVWNNSIKIAERLIKAGANVNYSDNTGKTVLFAAVICDSSEMINYLVEAGADIDHIDTDGKKALSYAYEKKSKEAVRLP